MSGISPSWVATDQTLRDAITEFAAMNDVGLLDKFFDEGELSTDEINMGFRKGIESCGLFPIVCSSVADNVGVSRLIEFLGNMAPSPEQDAAFKV